MFRFIENLRKKPENKRQGIVLAISFSITAVIALFWIVALVIKIQNGGVSFDSPITNTEEIKRSAEELKNSWDSFTDSLNNVIDLVGSPEATTTVTATTTTTATIPEE